MVPSLTGRRATLSPFATLWDLRRDVDRLFGNLTGPIDLPDAWFVPADVVETDAEFKLLIELPGFRPEDVELTVENNVLTVSGERKVEHEEGKKGGEYHLSERRYGRFERSFTLPRRVDTTRIQATSENGVLTVVMPKLEEAKPRRIQVGDGNGGRRIASD